MSREATRVQRDWLEGEVAAWTKMGLTRIIHTHARN